MNKFEFGRNAEGLAAAFLKEQGFVIVQQNYRQSFGEIDIVARDRDGETLCFVEVKAREHDHYGHPFEAVTASKQKTIRKVAQMYLLEFEEGDQYVRFDVIGIQFDDHADPVIEHLKNAF